MDDHDITDRAKVEEFANRVREAYEQLWGADGVSDNGDPFC